MSGDGPRAQESAFGVDILHLVPGCFAQLDDGHAVGAGARTGVVDQDVDVAEAFDGLLYHIGDLVCIRDIGGDGEGLLAGGFDFCDERGQAAPARFGIGLRVQVIDYEVAAFFGEALANGPANALFATRAGDEGYFTV